MHPEVHICHYGDFHSDGYYFGPVTYDDNGESWQPIGLASCEWL